MMTFNLATDPWIPVRFADGSSDLLGLEETFRRSSEISDFSVPTHERISLMRLLVCITQATLGAPDEPDEWDAWGSDLAANAIAYLGTWRDQFNLFGDGPRFLQSPVTGDKDYPTAQIAFQLSTGNTPTLLDHTGDKSRDFSPAFLARTLLAYQNHFVGGSLASKVKGNGPSLKALHSFLIGPNLHQTIILNCLDLETLQPLSLGKPSWEGGSGNDYLGRLSPAPCKLWLVDEGRGIRIDQGKIYPQFEESGIREPSTTVITGKRSGVETPVLLRATIGRGIWRDLHCITVISKKEQMAPRTFTSHYIDRHSPTVRFWSGELIKAKDAKILDSLESSFTVPWSLFTPAGQGRYQQGVAYAEMTEGSLKSMVRSYYDAVRPRPVRPNKDVSKDYPMIPKALRHYWHTLDHSSSILLDLTEGAGTAHDPLGAADFGKGKDPWTQLVRQAARDAYAATCPCTTPRQHKAFVAGLKQLQSKPSKKAAAKP